jgi:hypothetical protein
MGQEEMLIDSKQPFFVDMKLPFEVTASDKLFIPVTVVNASADVNLDVLIDMTSAYA